jgi:hypothetical protein
MGMMPHYSVCALLAIEPGFHTRLYVIIDMDRYERREFVTSLDVLQDQDTIEVHPITGILAPGPPSKGIIETILYEFVI